MDTYERDLLDAVDPERIAQLTLDLAAIPSPTGDSAAAAEAYACSLTDIGLDVSLSADIPNSPSVVARLRGSTDGPTLQFAGHLDTVPIPHAPPAYADGLLYGRGTADMKGALAAMAEAARVICQSNVPLRGTVLLTAFGLHEAPTGQSEGLRALIRKGIVGDAAIVCELGGRGLPIAGKGMGIFEITVQRPGDSLHELQADPGLPNPLYAAARVVQCLEQMGVELSRAPIPDVGCESVFVGMVHGGDFYNRLPTRVQITGTRRHGPDKCFEDTIAELRGLCARVQAEDASGQITVELTFTPVRESFRLSPDEPLVGIVRQAYADVVGTVLPLVGTSVVADASILIREAKIPAVYHGPWSDRAHADVEYVSLAELLRVTRVYVLSALRYCGVDGRRGV